MDLNWKEFRAPLTDSRFIIPVWSFTYDVQYVPTMIDQARLGKVMNIVASAVVESIKDIEGCPLSAIRMTPGTVESPSEEEGEKAYFTIANETPVYDFALQTGPRTFRLTKLRSSLDDLIVTVPIFYNICQQLFSEIGGLDRDSNPLPPLIDLLDVSDRLHTVRFSFEHRLRLGSHIAEQSREVMNTELIERLIKTTPFDRQQHPERDAPFLALNAEAVRRGDVTLAVEKSFGDKKRNIWVNFEAPMNIKQKDVDIRFDFSCGEGGASITTADLTDWMTPFVQFYRDLILQRFLPALMYDITFQPRFS
jgi:hypothetical protein